MHDGNPALDPGVFLFSWFEVRKVTRSERCRFIQSNIKNDVNWE